MTPIDQIKSHVASSREAEKNVSDWCEYSNEDGDWGIADKTGLVLFSLESKSLPFDKCESNIKFVASSRTRWPKEREALMILAEALDNLNGALCCLIFVEGEERPAITNKEEFAKWQEIYLKPVDEAQDALNRAAKLLQP